MKRPGGRILVGVTPCGVPGIAAQAIAVLVVKRRQVVQSDAKGGVWGFPARWLSFRELQGAIVILKTAR